MGIAKQQEEVVNSLNIIITNTNTQITTALRVVKEFLMATQTIVVIAVRLWNGESCDFFVCCVTKLYAV
jgi:hypothetical protein